MPTLDWIGKDKVVNHHLDVPYRVLERKYSFDSNGQHIEDNHSENMIIHGDNLEALKSLLPKYEGRIDCIYIDPPYNTGKEKWIYNDNVNDPQIKKWLGEVVGSESEDLSRHDKWLCMMYPRLKLLYKLLSEKGVIFISIDNSELFNLKAICDEIFNLTNFISLISVENNPKGRKNSKFVSVSSEYLLIYAKDKNSISFVENIPKKAKDLSVDENGRYVHNSGKRVLVGENDFNDKVTDFSSDKHYSVYYNKTVNNVIFKKEYSIYEADKELLSQGYERYFSYKNNYFVLNTYTQVKLKELFENQALFFNDGKIYEKNFSTTIRIKSMLVNDKYEAIIDNKKQNFKIDVKTTSAIQELKKIFNTNSIPFDNPKNIGLIDIILTLFDNKNLIVLDSFAGSGTTAHAIIRANKKDCGNRKYILIELMSYAENITAERVKRVIKGYGETNNFVEGIDSNFSYYELGEPLLIGNNLNENVSIEKIREYVYFMETKNNITNKQEEPYYMGSQYGVSYYFYYDKKSITTLNREFLGTIKTKSERYVIYADLCTLSEKE